ncbi:MAG: RDD family protein [Boseongicola sp.]|nr:RDD family protein [Boseongicola sp.]
MTLPHPETQPDFYEDVNTKRLIAWFIDVLLITAVTAVLTVFSLFTALFFLPFLYAAVGFFYRWIGLSRHSATIGMRVMSVEFRGSDGEDLDGGTAFLHTAGYYASVAIFPAQLVSIVLMLMSERKQGLTDMVLGTVLLNTRSR